jgi:hypothetical protein
LQWGFPIATTLSLNKPTSINGKKKWWRLKPGLAKRRALFPEGRGLGVGGRKRKQKSKSKRECVAVKSIETKENPTHFNEVGGERAV